MYILIYINYTEKIRGMHVRWNYPPCIQRHNKECLPFNTTVVLRGFIPRFSVTSSPFWTQCDRSGLVGNYWLFSIGVLLTSLVMSRADVTVDGFHGDSWGIHTCKSNRRNPPVYMVHIGRVIFRSSFKKTRLFWLWESVRSFSPFLNRSRAFEKSAAACLVPVSFVKHFLKHLSQPACQVNHWRVTKIKNILCFEKLQAKKRQIFYLEGGSSTDFTGLLLILCKCEIKLITEDLTKEPK